MSPQMVPMEMTIVNTFWTLEPVKDSKATSRSASQPPLRQNYSDDRQACFDKVTCWKTENLSGKRAVWADSFGPGAGEGCASPAAENNDDFEQDLGSHNSFLRMTTDQEDGFEFRRSEFQKKDELNGAKVGGDMQHVLELNHPASCAIKADSATQSLRQSPLVACFNHPTDWPRCQRNTTDQADVFPSEFFCTGAARRAPDVDELVALKHKLGQALTVAKESSVWPDQVPTSARQVHRVRNIPDVKELSGLKDKLRQALASCKDRNIFLAEF